MFNTEPFEVEFGDGDNVEVEFGEIQQGGGGVTRWSQLLDKPFERIGTTMRVVDGTLNVYISESANPAGGNTLSIG